jgi:hypothetical protein
LECNNYALAISYQPIIEPGSIIIYDIVYTTVTIDHEYNPDSHLTMKALVTLEWGMNVPVLTKLQSNFEDLMKLTDVHVKRLRSQTRKPRKEKYVGHSL